MFYSKLVMYLVNMGSNLTLRYISGEQYRKRSPNDSHVLYRLFETISQINFWYYQVLQLFISELWGN